jgi:hypothetical protein
VDHKEPGVCQTDVQIQGLTNNMFQGYKLFVLESCEIKFKICYIDNSFKKS